MARVRYVYISSIESKTPFFLPKLGPHTLNDMQIDDILTIEFKNPFDIEIPHKDRRQPKHRLWLKIGHCQYQVLCQY